MIEITPHTHVMVVNCNTGKVEWSGPWGRFAKANRDAGDELVSIRQQLEARGTAYAGGGAQPISRVSVI